MVDSKSKHVMIQGVTPWRIKRVFDRKTEKLIGGQTFEKYDKRISNGYNVVQPQNLFVQIFKIWSPGGKVYEVKLKKTKFKRVQE